MSALPPNAHFGALQQKRTTADSTPPHATSTSFQCPGPAGRASRRALQPAASVTARTPIARIGTATLSPMDALPDRREAQPLTHRQTLLILLGVLLPTSMGSPHPTIPSPALPTLP